MKRTPWFDARKVKPLRPGLYETRSDTTNETKPLREWTGYAWLFGPDFRCLGARSYFDELGYEPQWRGLAKKP